MISDIRFGLNALLEAENTVGLPAGRKGTLMELKHKLEAVEGEHSPETIKTLSSALQAFLDEELGENESKEESAMKQQKCSACGYVPAEKDQPMPDLGVDGDDEQEGARFDKATAASRISNEQRAAAQDNFQKYTDAERDAARLGLSKTAARQQASEQHGHRRYAGGPAAAAKDERESLRESWGKMTARGPARTFADFFNAQDPMRPHVDRPFADFFRD